MKKEDVENVIASLKDCQLDQGEVDKQEHNLPAVQASDNPTLLVANAYRLLSNTNSRRSTVRQLQVLLNLQRKTNQRQSLKCYWVNIDIFLSALEYVQT